jgi:hypothetical protein
MLGDQVPVTIPAVELTQRIARCVGIYETNRGGDEPAPQESALDTVAGIHASMATIEQATMGYAVDAFGRFGALRAAASPPLGAPEIGAASACCQAVATLLSAVVSAHDQGTEPDIFIGSHQPAIAATALQEADVRTMFRGADLKRLIDGLHGQVAAGEMTLDQAVASIPAADALGLRPGTLRSYIRTPRNWGENAAAWQRKAVRATSGSVGMRIETVAVSNNGTALAIPVIGRRVDHALAQTPSLTEREVVVTVAQQNNPNEPGYGENVYAIYSRLYPPLIA